MSTRSARWSLRARLLAGQIALLTAVCLGIGAATEVALHRYLNWRLAGYTPQEHLGGYAYVFVRGIPGALSGPMRRVVQAAAWAVPGVVVEQPPLQRLLALDALLRDGQP